MAPLPAHPAAVSSARLRKAVFPVAGLGTRFLPATKAVPKEMLPVVDRPLIQYAVEEAAAAGIELMVFVTGRGKDAIADHFDAAGELEAELEAAGKAAQLAELRGVLPAGVDCVYLRQPQALGLGHAVLCAEPAVGDEPFAVLLADDLIDADGAPCLAQMAEVWRETGGSVLAAEQVPPERISRYGVVAGEPAGERRWAVRQIVEKPPAEEAPSDLGVVGRYILTPDIFARIRETARGAGGEIQLTDAIALQLERGPVTAYRFEGRRYDCGSKLGFLQASVAYGLKRPDLGAGLREILDGL